VEGRGGRVLKTRAVQICLTWKSSIPKGTVKLLEVWEEDVAARKGSFKSIRKGKRPSGRKGEDRSSGPKMHSPQKEVKYGGTPLPKTLREEEIPDVLKLKKRKTEPEAHHYIWLRKARALGRTRMEERE